MSEFATTASLEIAVEQSSLSSARSTIESEFENISVGVEADSGGVTAGSLTQEPAAAATDGGQSVTDLLAEQLDVLEDIESGLDSGVGGGRDRSAVLPLVGMGALGGLIAAAGAGGALSPGLFGRGGVIEEDEGVGGVAGRTAEFFDDVGRDIGLPDLSEVTFDDLSDGVDRLHDWTVEGFDSTVDRLHEWTVAPFRDATEQLHDWSVAPFRDVTENLHDWTVAPFDIAVDQLHDWTPDVFDTSVDRLHDWTAETFDTGLDRLHDWTADPFDDAVTRLREWQPPDIRDFVPEGGETGASAATGFVGDQLDPTGIVRNRAERRRPSRADVTIDTDVTIDPSGLREIERRLDRQRRDIMREVESIFR